MPDKVTRSVLGRLGAPPMPLDPAVEDRIKGANRAKELEEEPRMVSLEDLRAKVGRDHSDEEFLLRAVMPADQVDAMVAAGPAAPTHDPATRGVKHLLAERTRRKGLSHVKIAKPGFVLDLKGGA